MDNRWNKIRSYFEFARVKNFLFGRKYWILGAILCFVAEFCLLAGPAGWLREEQINYLTGENSWEMEPAANSEPYHQTFTPQYPQLQKIGVVFSARTDLPVTGSTLIQITDAKEKVLFEKELDFSELEYNYFFDVDVNLRLNRHKTYCLNVYLHSDNPENVVTLRACSSEYDLPENIALTYDGPLENTQLVTRYSYQNAIPANKLLKALFLCGLTSLVIALGLPRNRYIRKIAGILLLAATPVILGQRLELLLLVPEYVLPFAMFWTMFLMYLLEIILLLCSHSLCIAACGSNLLLTLLYSANYFVFSYRGEPLRIGDFQSAGTAAAVMSGYNLSPNSHLAMAWSIALLFLVLSFQTLPVSAANHPSKTPSERKPFWPKKVWHLGCFVLGLLTAVLSIRIFLYTDFLVDRGLDNFTGWLRDANYYHDGYLIATLLDWQTNIKAAKSMAPEGYSRETAEALLDRYQDSQAADPGTRLPHVILILNESFSDLRVLGNLELSEENLSFFYSLKDNTVRGHVNSSVLGGTTANSEFEVLTGCSTALLPPKYIPYQQCIKKPTPSLVSNLEDLGYATYSLHPEPSSNWHRGYVYEFFGFDHSLWKDDFAGAEIIHRGVSDLEVYHKMEQVYENREAGKPLFLFGITMQNHGSYTQEEEPRPVTALNVSSREADLFLSLVQESDRAFEQLIEYFAKEEEPVIICMFGDHQPYFSEGSFYNDLYSQTENLTEQDKKLNQYKTPFIIWANYDIPEADDLDIGMSYLGALLLKTAKIPCSPYFSFLQEYMEKYPVVTVNVYKDAEGNYYDWSGDSSELSEYRILQYHYLFDS